MTVFQNILVLTDFSEHAGHAADLAITIGKKCQSTIHFLHFFSTPIDWDRLEPNQEKRYPETKAKIGHAKSQLSELQKKAEKEGLHTQQFVCINQGGDYLNVHINNNHHDLIVMGVKGNGPFHFGSLTTKVIKTSSCPVLIVNIAVEASSLNHIGFCTQFNKNESPSFEIISKFAKANSAALSAIHITTPAHFETTSEIEDNAQLFLKDAPQTSLMLLNDVSIESGIGTTIQKKGLDLLCLNSHRSGLFSGYFSHALVEKVAEKTTIPILCFPID